MIVLYLIGVMLAVYLFVEERERRKSNPTGPTFLERVKRSSREKAWAFLGFPLGLGISWFRTGGDTRVILDAIVISFVVIFVLVHDAVRSLPRSPELTLER